jgi:AraC family transcriptional regulator
MAGDAPQGLIFSESVMRLLVIEIAHDAWSVPLPSDLVPAKRDPRIRRATEYIEAHYAKDISLLDISRVAGLSPTHLTTLFQQETGQTPYSYVIDRRLKQAIHLLRKTNLPIAQVSYEAGFSDQQHMTRAFRSRLGRTPKAIRAG